MRFFGKGPKTFRSKWFEKPPRLKRIVKSGLCLMRGGKVLLARSKGDAHFQIPGGKIEPGETDLEALSREVAEELSLELDPARASPVDRFVAEAAGRADVLVEVRLYEAKLNGKPRASSEIAELVWQDPAHPSVACSEVLRLHILPFLARRGGVE